MIYSFFRFNHNWPSNSGFTQADDYHMTCNMIIKKIAFIPNKNYYLYSLTTSDTFQSVCCYIIYIVIFCFPGYVICHCHVYDSFLCNKYTTQNMCKQSNSNAKSQSEISISVIDYLKCQHMLKIDIIYQYIGTSLVAQW